VLRAYLRSWQYAGPDELTANWMMTEGTGQQVGDAANGPDPEVIGSRRTPEIVSKSTSKSKRRRSKPN